MRGPRRRRRGAGEAHLVRHVRVLQAPRAPHRRGQCDELPAWRRWFDVDGRPVFRDDRLRGRPPHQHGPQCAGGRVVRRPREPALGQELRQRQFILHARQSDGQRVRDSGFHGWLYRRRGPRRGPALGQRRHLPRLVRLKRPVQMGKDRHRRAIAPPGRNGGKVWRRARHQQHDGGSGAGSFLPVPRLFLARRGRWVSEAAPGHGATR